MARMIGGWLSGPHLGESGDPARGPDHYPGQRLGLPESGPGSLARTGRRIAALFVDWFIAYGLAALIAGFGLLTSDEFRYGWQGSTAVLVVWFVLSALSVRLFSFTPGQLLLGMQVASVDHRMHVGLGRAVMRMLLITLVVPPLFTDSDGRGLQDRLTGTAVLRRT
ncbi:RDD family protein [Mycobacterium sp. MYCO198283]|uniref:RDD family protein n=1 Tax=Mycobacterium sp. MYCO198283 TaxID=2883505 RepID=UPI001E3C9F5C|nr:RDD family protein [Mycobacterium sp. MYCO198283]MCG5432672.1 RDD family protein [Mycobacterium sp. MYCO198283]